MAEFDRGHLPRSGERRRSGYAGGEKLAEKGKDGFVLKESAQDLDSPKKKSSLKRHKRHLSRKTSTEMVSVNAGSGSEDQAAPEESTIGSESEDEEHFDDDLDFDMRANLYDRHAGPCCISPCIPCVDSVRVARMNKKGCLRHCCGYCIDLDFDPNDPRASKIRRRKSAFILLPDSNVKVLWDLIISFSIMYVAIATPVFLAFTATDSPGKDFMELLVDVLFAIDIILHFRTAIYLSGRLFTEVRVIAREYFKFWFWVDFLAILPIDHIVFATVSEGSSTAGLQDADYINLFKAIRLLRLGRVFLRVESFSSHHSAAGAWRFLRLGLFSLLCAHWFGCSWAFLANVSNEGSNWYVVNDLDQESKFATYAFSLHTGLLLFVGENVEPTTLSEVLFAFFALNVGAVLFAIILGNMTLLVKSFNKEDDDFRDKMTAINEEMSHMRLTDKLADRVRSYYNYLWYRNRNVFLGHSFVQEVNSSLKKDIMSHLSKSLVESVPMFQEADKSFVVGITENLRTEIYLPGEDVCEEGDVGDCMYFIARGLCEAYSQVSGTVYNKLRHGQHFGEVTLLAGTQSGLRRTASVRSVVVSDLRVLKKRDFDRLLHSFPNEAQKIRQEAKERLIKGKKREAQALAQGSEEQKQQSLRRIHEGNDFLYKAMLALNGEGDVVGGNGIASVAEEGGASSEPMARSSDSGRSSERALGSSSPVTLGRFSEAGAVSMERVEALEDYVKNGFHQVNKKLDKIEELLAKKFADEEQENKATKRKKEEQARAKREKEEEAKARLKKEEEAKARLKKEEEAKARLKKEEEAKARLKKEEEAKVELEKQVEAENAVKKKKEQGAEAAKKEEEGGQSE